MEDCVRLVCEALGVHSGEEVSVEKITELYEKVFHTSAEPSDTHRAITQVRTQSGRLTCSGQQILYILLEMKKEQEKQDKLYWELQMLKSGQSDFNEGLNTQLLPKTCSCKHKNEQYTKPFGLSSLLGRARRLYVRLDVVGVRSLLPSLSPSHVTSRRLGLINPTKSDVLLLLQYKYDIIKERLYREMLQDEHGDGCWESMEPSVQTDSVCDLEQRAEEAFTQSNVLCVCELPGALHCYRDRSGYQALLHSCHDEVRDTEGVWTSSTRGHGWTSAIFLSELRSHCEEETHSVSQLLNRVERLVLTEIYLSVCVSVRRAERETHSHTALLTSRQYWDNWPHPRRLCVEELVKFWLHEKQDLSTQQSNKYRTSSRCVRQAVLQCVVLCQEQERRKLVEILHSVSQEELQEHRHTHTPDYKAVGMTGWALRRGCVSILKQIKSSLQHSSSHLCVSWADCAVNLLTRLTHTHDEEVQSVIHTLLVMDASALVLLLNKYEQEVCSPKLHNLHNLLHTPGGENTQSAVPVSTEASHHSPSGSEEICTGCGVVFFPEDAPYLEILGEGEKREEERRKGREGEEEERRDEREAEEEMRDVREGEKEERRGGRDGEDEDKSERRSGKDEVREEVVEEEEVRREGRERERSSREEERNVDAVEKQCSLITQAWSKPVSSYTLEVTSALPVAQAAEASSTDSHTPDQTHFTSSQDQHTQRHTPTHTLVEPLQKQSMSSMLHPHQLSGSAVLLSPLTDAQDDSSSDTLGATALELDTENTPATSKTHTQDLVCDKQQLQREATMRSLVNIHRRVEQRWQQDRDRQILRVQERLSIIQKRKSEECMLGLRREETFRHLTNTLQQEDEQQQKVLVREKLQQLWRDRSSVIHTRRVRNTLQFKELLTPTAQSATNADVFNTTHTHQHNPPTQQPTSHTHT